MRIKSDIDNDAIQFYKYFYGENFIITNEEKKYNGIEVNGDVIFNLKLKKGNNSFTLLSSVIKEKYKKEKYKKIIEDIYNKLEILRYSPMNISICPKTGGLNIIKKAIGDDRLDTFAWLLNQYYKGITAPIINAGIRTNMYIEQRIELCNFLEIYRSKEISSKEETYKCVAKYFKAIYGIDDENYVRELIEKGAQAITTQEQFFDYIKEALDFWEKRMSNELVCKYLYDSEKQEYRDAIDKIRKLLTELLLNDTMN